MHRLTLCNLARTGLLQVLNKLLVRLIFWLRPLRDLRLWFVPSAKVRGNTISLTMEHGARRLARVGQEQGTTRVVPLVN